jgi:hypothetical protein
MAKRSEPTSPPPTAWIVINGRADRECAVLDASPIGAKLVFADVVGIPDRFDLAFFQGADRRLKCEATWRRGKVLGLKFII